jgi:hypothetical protein
MKARLTSIAAVIDIDRVLVEEASGCGDPPTGAHWGTQGERVGQAYGRQRASRIDRLLGLQFFARSAGLPITKRNRERNRSQCRNRRQHIAHRELYCHSLPLGKRGAPTIQIFPGRSTGLKILIVIAFVLIIASLASALVFLIRDKGKTHNTVRALAMRVGLSVALFIFILLAHQLGWIQSTGVPVMSR